MAEFLFAPEVTFGRLDRSVAQEKLDLLQLATRQMAEAGACVPQIVRGKIVESGLYRCSFHNVPDRLSELLPRPKRYRAG